MSDPRTDVLIDGKEFAVAPTAEEILAVTIRDELEIRLLAWKAERAELMRAADRIAVLSDLIRVAEDPTVTSLQVAPRPSASP